MPELEFLKQQFKHFKDKMINLIYGFTVPLKVSENISLSGDISSNAYKTNLKILTEGLELTQFCFKKQPANFFCRTYLFFRR
jgi:hypothetical protein